MTGVPTPTWPVHLGEPRPRNQRFQDLRQMVRKLHRVRCAGILVTDDNESKRTELLRVAIKRHLQRFPHAGDMRKGIVANWLPSYGFEDAPQLIDSVLETMVAAGELSPRQLPDGQILYVRGPALAAETRPTPPR